MTFTYDTTLSTNLALVRFHTGDVDSAAAVLADDTITALLASYGEVVSTVVFAALRHKLALLAVPNFTADWLTVDHASARAGILQLIAIKEAEFGISSRRQATTKHPYRPDSANTARPTWETDGFSEPYWPVPGAPRF